LGGGTPSLVLKKTRQKHTVLLPCSLKNDECQEKAKKLVVSLLPYFRRKWGRQGGGTPPQVSNKTRQKHTVFLSCSPKNDGCQERAKKQDGPLLPYFRRKWGR
jgi:hypothetical protein